ncbi:MAG: AbrB/MazE/SpoVT family DNA-binding domain-containing protein [Nitrososphaeraceae archaeon]
MTLQLDNGPIELRRVVQFNNSTSKGIVIPRVFVARMGIKTGDYLAIELDNNVLTMKRAAFNGEPSDGEGEEND